MRQLNSIKISLAVFVCLALPACTEPQIKPSAHHLQAPVSKPVSPPPALLAPRLPSPPVPRPHADTYTVVVNAIPLRELLFALAHDARINIDIAPDLEGKVTLNAIDQTLPQILERLARQADLRWEMHGNVLHISRDTPFLKNYQIDYVNYIRQAQANLNVAAHISNSHGSGGNTSAIVAGGGMLNNSSLTSISGKSSNDLWESLIGNLRDLLRETDRLLPEGSFEQLQENTGSQQTTGTGAAPPAGGRKAAAANIAGSPNPTEIQEKATALIRRHTFREAASVIANRETGVIAVRATARQHAKLSEFLEKVLLNARRQVLIEATVVEVALNDQSQTGVDWKSIALGAGFSVRQNLLGSVLDSGLDTAKLALLSSIMGNTDLSPGQKSSLLEQLSPGLGQRDANGNFVGSPDASGMRNGNRYSGGNFPLSGNSAPFTIGYSNRSGSFAAALSLLSQFGRTRVISSPKITALNNQPALLRVVDNLVYFTINAQTTVNQTSSLVTYTSTPNTVAVGFVLSVIPQIDDNDQVTLSIRPSISRLKGYAQDPNPALQSVPNMIPIIQTREMESVMKIPSGNIIMMGGLMEDSESKGSEGVPGLGELPAIGPLFSSRNQAASKTELVVFLRPIVVNEASLEGDYAFAKPSLPSSHWPTSPGSHSQREATSANPLPGGMQ